MFNNSNQNLRNDINEMKGRLGGKVLGDSSVMIHCPVHDDKNPSLHVSLDKSEKKILVKCFAGCSQDDVINKLKSLNLLHSGREDKNYYNFLPGVYDRLNDGKYYITHYEYVDKEGNIIGIVAKYSDFNDKTFIPYFKYNKEKWIAGYASRLRPLYGLKNLNNNPYLPVLVVEGEKCADAAQKLLKNHYVCITWPGGSNAVHKAEWSPLKGRNVTIFPDADDAGRKAAKQLKTQLNQVGAKKVDIVETPKNVGEGWDIADAKEQKWTQEQIIELFRSINKNENYYNKSSFKLVQAGSLEAKPPEHIVQNLLEKGSFSLIFGEPGSAKSFLAIDIACCVSTGKDFHGLAVQQGPVVYIAGEAHNGIARRLRSWTFQHNVYLANSPLYVSTGPASLCASESCQDVIAAIDGVIDYHPPILVIIDTLARNFGPGDENSTQDMSAFISTADRIREKYNCTVLLIHHTGHSDKSRARGAMALKGALDAEYLAQKDGNGHVFISATKMKEAELPDSIAFKLRQVKLDMCDELGDEVTSAVLETTEHAHPNKSGKLGKQTRGKWQVMAMQILKQLYEGNQDRLERSGYNSQEAKVSINSWRDACFDAGMPRQRWSETKKALEEAGHIGINDFYVELI